MFSFINVVQGRMIQNELDSRLNPLKIRFSEYYFCLLLPRFPFCCLFYFYFFLRNEQSERNTEGKRRSSHFQKNPVSQLFSVFS